ncbi:MAG TPA: hypothetical protein VFS96_01325 [Nitrolancea sp.]|nr:hypothetical protein [Nitrolancea sp.]
MERVAAPRRNRAPWSRLGQRVRCWIVRYASVAAITMALLSEKPASTARFDRPPLVAAARVTPVGGYWDPAEILEGPPLRVILIDAPSSSQSADTNTVLYRN